MVCFSRPCNCTMITCGEHISLLLRFEVSAASATAKVRPYRLSSMVSHCSGTWAGLQRQQRSLHHVLHCIILVEI